MMGSYSNLWYRKERWVAGVERGSARISPSLFPLMMDESSTSVKFSARGMEGRWQLLTRQRKQAVLAQELKQTSKKANLIIRNCCLNHIVLRIAEWHHGILFDPFLCVGRKNLG
jgi:hypothetical protein